MWGHNGPGYPTSPPPHASACRLPAGGRSRQTREVVGRWGPGPLRARIRHGLLPRCKRQMQDAQHKQATQGGGGGKREGGQTKPNRRPTETATEQEARNQEKEQTPTKTNKPFGLRRNRNPRKQAPEKPGGEGHAVCRKSMKEKNSSKWIVMSSVVPKTKKPGKQKNTEKQPATAVIEVSRTAEKKHVVSQPALPPLRQKEEIGKELNPRNNI